MMQVKSVDAKIVIQNKYKVVEWYRSILRHPGETATQLTIGQCFHWKGLQKSVHDICSKCYRCQFSKRGKRNYSKL